MKNQKSNSTILFVIFGGLIALVIALFLYVNSAHATYKPEPRCFPSVQVTPTPSPTIEPTPTPEATPSATPTPEPKHEDPSPAGVPASPACKNIPYAPTIIATGRISPTSIWVKWTPVADYVHTYLVWYGPSKDLLVWNTFAEHEYTELHQLPTNSHIWIKVAGTHESCVGPFSTVVDP